jgi:hypothetical protein
MKENVFQGRIVDDRPQGFDHLLSVRVDTEDGADARLHVRIPHPVFVRLELAPGQKRTFAVKPSSIHILPATGDKLEDESPDVD